ncbi:uncharacterized protein LOC117587503 [Drosophila guanche]|uniref:uncharacterized protein LOC117587503 n=1 Tax=Drosophila guanche TaxID=7266 RepID=UPI0014712555|nr:uncharacterized protein LOC117587503 [Drosophila guanche]
MTIQFLLLGALLVLSSQALIREPYPSDCKLFYETRELSCPPDLHWNAQLQRCGIETPAGCSDTVPADSLSVACAGKLGQLIPYPGDCTRFIQCDYLPFVKTCPQYLFWNSKLLTCDKMCV